MDRQLEAILMLMESLENHEQKICYDIVGLLPVSKKFCLLLLLAFTQFPHEKSFILKWAIQLPDKPFVPSHLSLLLAF